MKVLACILLLAAALTAYDVNVTGKWTGSFNMTAPDGETHDSTALLILKQEGTNITGSVGPNEGEQYTIKKGTIEGSKITIEVEHESDVIKFALILADERITDEANFSHDGQMAKAKIDIKREK